MKSKLRNNKAFTLMELMVAMGILVVVLSFSSIIFKISIDSQRTAIANAEIMKKLRAITAQLNADFKGLNKNGEILLVWKASAVTDPSVQDNDLDGYERFDRIMFFADGDFHSYGVNPSVRGNTAMICYMIARNGKIRPSAQDRNKRVLTRTQHILTAEQALVDFLNQGSLNDAQWLQWRNRSEYDKISIEQWKRIPWENKKDMLSVLVDVSVAQSSTKGDFRGADVELTDANSIHMLLCEGVGEFKIQGWSDAQQQWIPEVDPDGDGDVADDTHFYLEHPDPNRVPGVLYPYPPYGSVDIRNITYPIDEIDKEHFNSIPGLGRALKFTFTLYDSKNIIKHGRTFTHIVYLDD